MNNIKKLIGQRIRARRIEKGFGNQTLFAKTIGTDTSRVSRWETGEDTPGPIHQAAICKALDCGPELFDEKVTPEKAPTFEQRKLELISIIMQIDSPACLGVAETALSEIILKQNELRNSRSRA